MTFDPEKTALQRLLAGLIQRVENSRLVGRPQRSDLAVLPSRKCSVTLYLAMFDMRGLGSDGPEKRRPETGL